MEIFVILLFAALLIQLCRAVWSWFDHSGWNENADPSPCAVITEFTPQKVQYTKNNAKFKTTVKFSDGFYFVTHKTERDSGFMTYRISIDRNKITELATQAHQKAVEKKLKHGSQADAHRAIPADSGKNISDEFVSVYMQTVSAPLGDREDAWKWMMGRMRYFRDGQLDKQLMFMLASNVMLNMTETYQKHFPEFLEVVEHDMIIALVAQLLKDEKTQQAKEIAQPFWDYFGQNKETLNLKKEEIILLAMAVSQK